MQHLGDATIVIKAAAVADYRAAHPSSAKIRSSQERLSIELRPNPDILKEVAARRGAAFVVGFAAETGDVAAHAVAKLRDKGIDLLVANDVSREGIGFDADDNEVVLVDRWGGIQQTSRRPKAAIADAILDRVLALRAQAQTTRTR